MVLATQEEEEEEEEEDVLVTGPLTNDIGDAFQLTLRASALLRVVVAATAAGSAGVIMFSRELSSNQCFQTH